MKLHRPAAFVAAIVLGLGSCLHGGPPTGAAQTPNVAPTRATVLVRVVGDLELVRSPEQAGGDRARRTDVQLGTGSGLLISPAGHVLTAAHVVMAESGTVTLNGVRVEVRPTIRRIEVWLPRDDSLPWTPGVLEASILAADQAADLAVLLVGGSNLPFLDLGDSDALEVGDLLEAVGFPFGEQVEIARPGVPLTAAPAASVGRGNLSAFREDAQGERRYIQVTTPLNSGNSGGPIVDEEGYVVGIANSELRSRQDTSTGVGFGVTVNLAKRFLESYGVDSALRARRASAGPAFTLAGKGLRLPLLVGMTDSAAGRTRVEAASGSADGILLRADRVVSPWPAARVAAAFVSGRAFEPFTASSSDQPRAARGGLLLGRATGTMDDGTAVRIEYAVLEAGAEKVVARLIGPPYQVAYNASVLRSVLLHIEMDALRAPGRALAGPLTWAHVTPARGTAIDRVLMPAGWLVETAGPLACDGLPPLSDAVSVSPPSDFTVALRAGWYKAPGLTAHDAAASCGIPARQEPSAYIREFTFLGARHLVEGRFFADGTGGLLQFESVAPAEQATGARRVFDEWLGKQAPVEAGPKKEPFRPAPEL